MSYFFIFIHILKELLFANGGEPDQTPRFAASDLVLYCLPMSHRKDARIAIDMFWAMDSKNNVVLASLAISQNYQFFRDISVS